MQVLQAIRGMNDILPQAAPYWQLLEEACRSLAERYAYQEIRFPIVEPTELFSRTIGKTTDIVEKEMYTFEDRNGDSLTLRPEGTAGCVRAGIQHGMLYNRVLRLWYMGPMFRHERPQKGRYRQFHQFGVEAFGMVGPDIDVEQILMCQRLWEMLGLTEQITLQINSLGTVQARLNYRKVFVDYFQSHYSALDTDSQRRLQTNPLRILDSKTPQMQDLIHHAPKLLDYIDEASRQHFDGLRRLLDAVNIPYEINPHLVRGLDYYSMTVYEWVTTLLGAQGTVCAGGRYDALVEQLGGKPTPAVGYALGLERLALLLEKQRACEYAPDVFFVMVGEHAVEKGLLIAEQLRQDEPQLRVETSLSGGSFKSQFKRADKSRARWALVLGDEELKANKISIKDLRQERSQQQLSYDELLRLLREKSV